MRKGNSETAFLSTWHNARRAAAAGRCYPARKFKVFSGQVFFGKFGKEINKMPFFFGGPSGRPPRRGRGWGRGYGPRRFWGPPPPMGMGMGYYPRRRFYNNGRNSLLGALGLGALGFVAGRLFGGNRGGFGGPGGGGFGGPGGISGSGGADWGGPGGGSGSSGSFDAGGGGDWGN